MNDNVKKVFEMLGVEPNEEFKTLGAGSATHRIDSELAVHWRGVGGEWSISVLNISNFLNGSEQIIKKPWKPKELKTYFFYDVRNDYKDNGIWSDSIFDDMFYKTGNCFRTPEEITPEVIEQLKAFYKSDEVVRKC